MFDEPTWIVVFKSNTMMAFKQHINAPAVINGALSTVGAALLKSSTEDTTSAPGEERPLFLGTPEIGLMRSPQCGGVRCQG